MALESGTFIDSLNVANPVSTDALAQADDHLRLIKSTIKATFPNVAGAVTLTHSEINARNALVGNLTAPQGTKMLFASHPAPTGWTTQTDNDKALRVVNGSTTLGTGGSAAFTSAFASQTPSGTVSTTFNGTTSPTTLSVDQIPSHNHTFTEEFTKEDNNFSAGSQRPLRENSVNLGNYTITTATTGGGQGHDHDFAVTGGSTFAGDAMNLAVEYVDVIIAQKD